MWDVGYLPLVMIWFGSNDNSPSFSAKQAYSVRTRLRNYELLLLAGVTYPIAQSLTHSLDSSSTAAARRPSSVVFSSA